MEENNQKGTPKTIYLDKEAFAIMAGLMVEEKKSLSEIINQALRKYFRLDYAKRRVDSDSQGLCQGNSAN